MPRLSNTLVASTITASSRQETINFETQSRHCLKVAASANYTCQADVGKHHSSCLRLTCRSALPPAPSRGRPLAVPLFDGDAPLVVGVHHLRLLFCGRRGLGGARSSLALRGQGSVLGLTRQHRINKCDTAEPLEKQKRLTVWRSLRLEGLGEQQKAGNKKTHMHAVATQLTRKKKKQARGTVGGRINGPTKTLSTIVEQALRIG